MKEITTLTVMGYPLLRESLTQIEIGEQKQVINTLNPHSYILAKSDQPFEEALRASDLLLPDGSGMVLAAQQINQESLTKVAGSDLHHHLLQELDRSGGSCFYMGARDHTLGRIEARLKREYPNLRVGFYAPPSREVFSTEESQEIISQVNAFKPDVLFVGLTAPKQEKWLHAHQELLEFKIGCCVGAVFDFYAGTIQRSSQFWIDHHLEWLPRLFREPKRMWRRNFISTPLFLLDMLRFKLGWKCRA